MQKLPRIYFLRINFLIVAEWWTFHFSILPYRAACRPLPPYPSKCCQKKILSRVCAIFWKVCKNNFLILFFWLTKFPLWESRSSKFLQTLFRNDNQWYPITSWLGRCGPKAFKAWGWRIRWGTWESQARHEPGGYLFISFIS